MARFWRQTLRRIPTWDACLALAVPAGCAGMLAEAYTRTAIGDAEPAAACAFAPLALSAANAETLTRRGLVVVEDVLSARELAAARRDAAPLARFAPAADHGLLVAALLGLELLLRSRAAARQARRERSLNQPR